MYGILELNWLSKVLQNIEDLGLGPHLFVKVPRPVDSEVYLCGLRFKLPPVTTSLTTHR